MTIIGVPTNTKFIKRILGNKAFQENVYSTNFIQDEHDQLFESVRNTSLARKSNISAAQTYLETLKFRAAREHNVDPWEMRD
jgi:pyruvate carboxylase